MRSPATNLSKTIKKFTKKFFNCLILQALLIFTFCCDINKLRVSCANFRMTLPKIPNKLRYFTPGIAGPLFVVFIRSSYRRTCSFLQLLGAVIAGHVVSYNPDVFHDHTVFTITDIATIGAWNFNRYPDLITLL